MTKGVRVNISVVAPAFALAFAPYTHKPSSGLLFPIRFVKLVPVPVPVSV